MSIVVLLNYLYIKLCAGEGKGLSITIIAIMVPIGVFLVVFSVSFYFLSRKAQVQPKSGKRDLHKPLIKNVLLFVCVIGVLDILCLVVL